MGASLLLAGLSTAFETFVADLLVGAAIISLAAGFTEALLDLRATQQQLVDQASIVERQRIASELHDVAGHAMAVTMLHITSARLPVRSDPEAAIEALEDAEHHGRASMDDLRSVVRLLKSEGSDDFHALPALSDLTGLVDSYRSAGAAITWSSDAPPEGLRPTASLIAYRVVQEGLTNAVRHGTGPITASISNGDGTLDILVENRSSEDSGSALPGTGLVGLAERVESVGGTFRAGPVGSGARWRLSARIPA